MVNISNLKDNLFGMSVVSMPNSMKFPTVNPIQGKTLKLTITKTICGVHTSRELVLTKIELSGRGG